MIKSGFSSCFGFGLLFISFVDILFLIFLPLLLDLMTNSALYYQTYDRFSTYLTFMKLFLLTILLFLTFFESIGRFITLTESFLKGLSNGTSEEHSECGRDPRLIFSTDFFLYVLDRGSTYFCIFSKFD